MPVYALGEHEPQIHPDAYIAPEAVIIGRVSIGPESTVWPGAVLRGDDNTITIGAGTSVQDNAVLHVTKDYPTTVGDRVTIGHLAHLEGCTIEDEALVGTGAIVLHEAVVGPLARVGAGAVVPGRIQIPGGAMALGTPAKIREGVDTGPLILDGIETYIRRGKAFRTELRRID